MRSNCTENDYLIKETALDKIVANVLIKNKDDLLENKMNMEIGIFTSCIHISIYSLKSSIFSL